MASPFGGVLSSVKSKLESLSVGQIIMPLLALIIVAGALVVGDRVGRNPQQTNNPKTGITPTPTQAPLEFNKFTPFVPRTYKLLVEFDTQTRGVSLKEFSVLSDTISSDTRLATFFNYRLEFYDKANKKLASYPVIINEVLFAHPVPGESYPAVKLPRKLLTPLYAPYDSRAEKIALMRNNVKLLESDIPDHPITEEPQSATTLSCGKKVVVIISDGYSDISLFEEHADTFINAASKAPYSADMFDFKIYPNTTSLGCSTKITDCFNNPALISTMQKAKAETGATGVVVLANGGGVSASVLGDAGPAIINGLTPSGIDFMATHEFLGHMMGLLYDRYYTQAPGLAQAGLAGDLRSNCTDSKNNPPAWWGEAGSTGTYPGCANNPTTLYAPLPSNCGTDGPSNTSMSNCIAPLAFDPIEKYWIENYMIPKLNCQNVTSPDGGGVQEPTFQVAKPNTCSDTNYDVTFSWNGVGSGWFVNISEDPTFSGWSQKDVSGTSSTTAPAGFNLGLTFAPGKTYYSRLYYGVVDKWTPTKSFSVAKCTGPGSNPGGGVTPGVTTYSVTVTWNLRPEAVGGYEVEQVAGTTPASATAGAGATSHTFSGLAKGVYSWRIWSLDTSGNRLPGAQGYGQNLGY